MPYYQLNAIVLDKVANCVDNSRLQIKPDSPVGRLAINASPNTITFPLHTKGTVHSFRSLVILMVGIQKSAI